MAMNPAARAVALENDVRVGVDAAPATRRAADRDPTRASIADGVSLTRKGSRR
jgi:hypothetical protein